MTIQEAIDRCETMSTSDGTPAPFQWREDRGAIRIVVEELRSTRQRLEKQDESLLRIRGMIGGPSS